MDERIFPEGEPSMRQPDLDVVLDVGELRDGERLCVAGDPCTGAWRLIEGTLILESQVRERRGSCVRRWNVGPGQWVGVVSMLDGGPRVLGMRALGSVKVGLLTRERFQEMLRGGDPAGVALLAGWLGSRARALDRVNRENVRMLRLAAEL